MPAFDVNHKLAWLFAQQCFRIGIVSKSPALLQESFITNEANRPWMYDRIVKLSMHSLMFPFDTANDQHATWAALSYGIGLWGMIPATFDVYDLDWIQFAVEETRKAILNLREQHNSNPAEGSRNTMQGTRIKGEALAESEDNAKSLVSIVSLTTNAAVVSPDQNVPPAADAESYAQDVENRSEYEKDRDVIDLDEVEAPNLTILTDVDQLRPADLDHLQDIFRHAESVAWSNQGLLNAVFHSWNTSMEVSEDAPQAPEIRQTPSSMNRVQVGVLKRDCTGYSGHQRRMTRAFRAESTEARKKGQPVFYYGATKHGLPIWECKDSMGITVDEDDVAIMEERLEGLVLRIGKKWSQWAKPRVRQHNLDVLVWMVRRRLGSWYGADGIFWGDGMPVYSHVELPEFKKWELEPYYNN